MTTNQPDRLSQIENLLQSFITTSQAEREAERQASNERLTRIEQLVDSNSRSIQALADRISEMSHKIDEATEERAELRRATIGIANLLSSLDSDRPTILRKLNSIENKVDQLLEQQDRENNR